LVPGFIALGVGGGVLYKCHKISLIKRMMTDTPQSKIRSIAMGFVKIYGETEKFKEVLKSPLSGTECMYYKVDVQEEHTDHEENGSDRTYWVTTQSENKAVPFYLKDSTGKVLVDSSGASIYVTVVNEYNSSMGKDPPANVMRYIKEKGVKFEGLLGINKTMRYQEMMILPKQKLYIMGTAGDNPYVEEATAKQSVEDIMIQAGKTPRSFFISVSSEQQILKSYRMITIAGPIIGGIIAAGGMLWMLMVGFAMG